MINIFQFTVTCATILRFYYKNLNYAFGLTAIVYNLSLKLIIYLLI